jgi:hypothetical protein
MLSSATNPDVALHDPRDEWSFLMLGMSEAHIDASLP